jgi:hypothetical protein
LEISDFLAMELANPAPNQRSEINNHQPITIKDLPIKND